MENKASDLFLIGLIYFSLFVLLLVAYRLYPTNKGGPGLDLMVFLGILLYAILAIIRTDRQTEMHKRYAHAGAIVLLVICLLITH